MKKKFGNFIVNLKNPLGVGVMGQLYRAKLGNEDIVCKVIDFETPKAQDEARCALDVLIRLCHPNLVRYFNYFIERERIFIFMEYCKEGNIRKFKFEEELGINILEDVIEGLRVLAVNQIAHANLKPENILVSNGQLKLSDYGLAIIVEGQRQIIPFNRSSKYRAPEYIMDEYCTNSVDMWSLGVLLYEIKFEECPFQGDNHQQLYQDMKQKIESNQLQTNLKERIHNQRFGSIVKMMLVLNWENRLRLERIMTIDFKRYFTFIDNPSQKKQHFRSNFIILFIVIIILLISILL